MHTIKRTVIQKNNPLVSIITPSFNQGRFIEQTIISVLKQTYSNVEHIILDGGSSDNTIDIIKKYSKDSRIKWLSKKDNGQYDAVNKGFMMAKGEILGWINTDDIYAEYAVEKIVEVFSEMPDVEIVYGKFYSFTEKRKLMRRMFSVPFSYKWLRRYCFVNPSFTFIKASIIRQEGFLIDNSVPTYGDWDWFLRMAESGKRFHRLTEFIGYFRIHPNSRIMRMSKKEIRRERLLISRRHNLPLSYIYLWSDLVVPWIERLQNLFDLVKKGEWYEIVNRLFDNCTKPLRSLINKSI